MSRLDIKTPSKAQTVVDNLYRDVERRIAASPPGLCPVDMSLTFLQLCHAQSCGKCVPCRIGLGQLTKLIGQVLDGEATLATLAIIEKTARSIVNTADCAIGRDAARLVVDGLEGFREDYVEHIAHHRCLASLSLPVPCVALCPAGVDVPGYMALVGEGRCADAVRLIRKDNPMPTSCAYICEHPCEARCRRDMIDAPLNIRGLKRYAVDHAGEVPQPECAPATGKTVAVIGGGNTAAADAMTLSRICEKVILVHRRDSLRATKVYHKQLEETENIEFYWNTTVSEFLYEKKLTGAKLHNVKTGEDTEISVDGAFISIGRKPASELFEGILDMDEAGYIVADESTRTNIPGVFAIGDVRTKALRQVVTAVADGATASHYIEEYLAHQI